MVNGPPLACVCLPALPLQLLVRRHPQWRELPTAVIDEDRPQGRLLHINRSAREAGLLPGISYAAGLSLTPQLNACVVPAEELQREVEALAEALQTLSPHVEPCETEAGVFWLDVSGLERLFGSAERWVKTAYGELRGRDLWPRIVVGWSRFGTYALARGGREAALVLEDEASERHAASAISLSRLGLSPRVRDGLGQLGVRDVGALLALPADGVRRRFGAEALELWRLAAGHWRPSLRPQTLPPPLRQVHLLDRPVLHSTQVLFVVKRSLHRLLSQLAARHQALATLVCELKLEKGPPMTFELCPAEPTLEEHQLLDLVRLKLDSTQLVAAVEEVALSAEPIEAQSEQLQLFRERGQRDLKAAKLAIARLRAELGDGAVTRAELTAGNLPEAQFRWAPAESVALPEAQAVASRTLVRRMMQRAVRLPPQPRQVRDEGWLIRGVEHGAAVRSWGPYVISGGWWVREVHREYRYTELQSGQLFWLYYDRARRRWYQQGVVC